MTTDKEKFAAKQKKQWILAGGLVVFFIYSFSVNVLFRKKAAPAASAPVAVSSQSVTQNLTEDLLFVTNLRMKDKLLADQTAIWDKEWGRDPFVPQATLSTVVKAVNLTLKGILWDAKVPRAIVNEKTLVKGDTIYGYTLMDIKRRSVILRTGEKNIELQVFSSISTES